MAEGNIASSEIENNNLQTPIQKPVHNGEQFNSSEHLRTPDITKKIARAFLKQDFGLSSEGDMLKKEVQQALDANDTEKLEALKDRLPTVEHPHLQLFKDFDLTTDDEGKIFGWDLANVQVTKGCSHNCDFCAISASGKMDRMPYAAVLKIAEEKKKYEQKAIEAYNLWSKLKNHNTLTNNGRDMVTEEIDRRKIEEAHTGKLFEDIYPELRKTHTLNYLRGNMYYSSGNFNTTSDMRKAIWNYWDSDPFDYRDNTFLHEDVTPADYGDVFSVLSSEIRPIGIKTTGWNTHNKIAQRAAEKIVDLCSKNPKLSDYIGISIHRYETRYKINPLAYMDDLKNILTIFSKINQKHKLDVVAIMFDDPEDPENADFIRTIANPLKEFIQQNDLHISTGTLEPSYYSGKLARPKAQLKRSDEDVFACMPGVHILPDGSVEYQKQYGDGKVPEGTRPITTGIKLYNRV